MLAAIGAYLPREIEKPVQRSKTQKLLDANRAELLASIIAGGARNEWPDPGLEFIYGMRRITISALARKWGISEVAMRKRAERGDWEVKRQIIEAERDRAIHDASQSVIVDGIKGATQKMLAEMQEVRTVAMDAVRGTEVQFKTKEGAISALINAIKAERLLRGQSTSNVQGLFANLDGRTLERILRLACGDEASVFPGGGTRGALEGDADTKGSHLGLDADADTLRLPAPHPSVDVSQQPGDLSVSDSGDQGWEDP